MNGNTLKKKFIIIFLIIAMIIPYVPVFTPEVEAAGTQYNYTGGVQTFTAPKDGIYKLEVWGASGGYASNYDLTVKGGTPGYGGYSSGYVKLKAGQTIYICVGGKGEDNRGVFEDQGWSWDVILCAGGYNGGGNAGAYGSPGYGGGGGGATHIATTNRGELYNYEWNKSEVLIVAGGGGGGASIACDVDEDYNGPGHTHGGAHSLKRWRWRRTYWWNWWSIRMWLSRRYWRYTDTRWFC